MLKNMSLAQLGAHLLDTADNAALTQEYNLVEQAGKNVGNEIIRRIGRDKVRPMMDFHYEAWANATGNEVNTKWYEFKAMTAAHIQAT